MLLSEVATILGDKVVVAETTANGWSAAFHHSDIQQKSCFGTCVGFGKTPKLAKKKLAKRIAGQRIIQHPHSPRQRDIQLPKKVTLK